MYRDVSANLDERDRAVGAILIGETLIAACERAQLIGKQHHHEAWRAIRDAHDDFPEIWRNFDQARQLLALRGANVNRYDEMRPHVRTRLATGADDDSEAVQVDPVALDDARRAAEELKLAVPGADWAAIDQRTRGLVRVPLLKGRHNVLAVIGVVTLFGLGIVSWLAATAPDVRPDRKAVMRSELAEISYQRGFKILELQHALAGRCLPVHAQELAKHLVFGGRSDDARQFAAHYTAHCGPDEIVERWANAALLLQ